jgi:transposase-like protein
MPTSPNNTAAFDKITDHVGNEDQARELLESVRWPDGPICPHCGEINNAGKLTARPGSKKPVRKGVWKCYGCCEQFSVTVGTVFEDSHIPLHKWLWAAYLMCASKKSMSAHQIHRMTGISYKSTWFMCHRLRYAMAQNGLGDLFRGVVEIDEAYVGPKAKPRKMWQPFVDKKVPVVSMLERHTGRVRSIAMERVTVKNLTPILHANVCKTARIHTDDHPVYTFLAPRYAGHDVVTHTLKEYARRENGRLITTNTVEGFFSLVKRGVYGTYHHVGRAYLQQYLNEFDFRYNARKVSDSERTILALKAIEGKRLTLREPERASA